MSGNGTAVWGHGQGGKVGDDARARWSSMTKYGRNRQKSTSKRVLSQKHLDRTAGYRWEHYGRKDVYAANAATRGQDHE